MLLKFVVYGVKPLDSQKIKLN